MFTVSGNEEFRNQMSNFVCVMIDESTISLNLASSNMWLSNTVSPWMLIDDHFPTPQWLSLSAHSSVTSVLTLIYTKFCVLSFFFSVSFRRSLMNSELCPTPTRTSSSCASAWSTPTRFTTSPRSGCRTSGLTTRPHPSCSSAPSRTSCWTWTSSSTWTDLTSSPSWAPVLAAWRRRSGQRTISSALRSRKRTWRRRSMPPSSPP